MRLVLRQPERAGFTLIEVTISLVIVAGLLVAAASTVGTTAGMQRVRVAESLGMALAQDLAGEIVRCRYEDPDGPPVVHGPEADEATAARDEWDDVDDYHGWSASPPTDRAGGPIASLAGWTRNVDVTRADPANPAVDAAGGSDSGLKRITVTVTAPDGNVTTFVTLRSRLGCYDLDPPLESTLVMWVGISMQIGPDPDRAVQTGVQVSNQVAQED